MTMLDLSNEENQKEFANGPVPSGSVVMVEVEVLKPTEERQDIDNPFIYVSKTGLKQISCQFVVSHGTYQGVRFRQNITLPLGVQNITLSPGQRTACNIGGATLKAMCIAAKKPPRIQDVTSLTGMKFPVRVKINPRSTTKEDKTYWNNELAFIVTPDKEEYVRVASGGEVITDGPVMGSEQPTTMHAAPESENYGQPFPTGPSEYDSVPF